MKFKVLLPSEVFLKQEVTKIVAEAVNGSFCLMPKHVDFVAALVPGLMSIEDDTGVETFLALDEGVLVKHGQDVLVSTRNAVHVPDLGSLKQIVEEQFKAMDDKEKVARAAAARLEADLVRRFMEIK